MNTPNTLDKPTRVPTWSPTLGATFSPTDGKSSVVDRLGSSAEGLWSPINLGSKRGYVPESEGAYQNPTFRLRRDSDDTEKSFDGKNWGSVVDWVNTDVSVLSSTDVDTWNKSNITSVTDGQADPDGGTSAQLVTVAAASGHLRDQCFSNQFGRKVSIYAKAGTLTSIDIRLGVTTPEVYLRWDLTDGSYAVLQDNSTSKTITVTDAGSGWYQMVLETTGTTLNDYFAIYFTGAVATDTFYLYAPTAEVTIGSGYVTTLYDQSGWDSEVTHYNNDHDFEDGVWALAGVGTIDSATQYTTSGAGGVRITGIITAGQKYRARLQGTNTVASTVVLKDYGNTTAYGTIVNNTSPFDTVIEFTAVDTGIYLRNSVAGTVNVLQLELEEVSKFNQDMIQATAASQPKAVSNGALVVDSKGNPSVLFDGTDDYLQANGVASAITGTDTPVTMYSASETSDVNNGGQAIAALGNSAAATQLIRIGPTDSAQATTCDWQFFNRDDASVDTGSVLSDDTVPENTLQVHGAFSNGNWHAGHENGVWIDTKDVDYGARTLNTFAIGAQVRTTTSAYLDGYITAVLVYSAVQARITTVAEDDAADDDTADWLLDDSTLAFSTDHYVWSHQSASQWAGLVGAENVSEGDLFRFSVDLKDGTHAGVTVGIGYINAAPTGATEPGIATTTTTAGWVTYTGTFVASSAAAARPYVALYALMSGAGNIEFKNFKIEKIRPALIEENLRKTLGVNV